MSTAKGKLICYTECGRSKPCMFLSHNIKLLLISEVHFQVGGDNNRLLFDSVYLPYNATEAPPSLELRRIVEFGAERGNPQFLGCDTNAHNT